MRFLHTSDLHLGKKLDGITRIDEQREVLNEIISIANSYNVSVVLIAGDVFDTFIPSAEAENLFFDFVDALSQSGRTVVCISGNHDDDDRLTASKTLASKRGVYLCGDNQDFCFAEFNGISLTDKGKSHLVLSDGSEKCFIATVPYFGEAPVGAEVDKEESFGDRVSRILSEVFSNKREDESGILLTHLFMLGGDKSEGERDIDLGGVKVVSPSAIPDSCIYTALGHLHKRQVISRERNAIYSGSPLQYAYDEVGSKKSVTVFDILSNKVENLCEIELESGKRLAKVSCLGIEDADEILSENSDCYVDLTVVSDRPLLLEETASLKSKHPNITKIRLELSGNADTSSVIGRKNMNDKELFVEFYKGKYGSEPDNELLSAYLEVMMEEKI